MTTKHRFAVTMWVRGEQFHVEDVALACEQIDVAAKYFMEAVIEKGGLTVPQGAGKVVHYPYHSIVRVETSEEVYNRAIELEQDRMPKLRVRGRKKIDA